MPDTEASRAGRERQFCLPDLGEGLTSAEIVGWRVAVGDTITVDQPVVEVETAKATVEVPAPFAGVVHELHGAPGDTVEVGSPLLTVEAAGFAEPGVATPEVAAPEQSGAVLVGYGTRASARRQRRRRVEPAGHTQSTGPADRAGHDQPSARARPSRRAEPAERPQNGHAVPVISPLVRKLARDHGLDVAALRGSGPRGTVLRRDVEAALTERAIPTPDAARSGQRVPLTGARRVAAERLARSRREIPEATVWVDVDATELLAARAALNAARPDQPVSLVALLGRFAVLGLRRYPELNARVDDDALTLLDEVNLGFAAQTDRGLLVPVVHGAHRKTTRELAAALGALTEAARAGTINPRDLTGGTFTVNNYGVFGVDGSAAIINHPEVAILGMGRIIDRPWVVGGELTVRKVSELTLAFDHRACDGGTAGGFLRFVADCVESPVTALGDL